jgi:hypothetical protein
MATLASLPSGVGESNLAQLLELVGLPSEAEHASKHLSGSTDELIRSVVSVIDGLVLFVMEKRTAQDFISARAETFPQYFVAMRALGDLMRILIPKHALERLIAESLSELEADFRDLGAQTFGRDLRDRGIFTVWTLRKINDLAQEVGKLPAPPKGNETAGDIVMKFAAHAIWTRFHIDCLVKSMRSNKPIFPEVVDVIVDGLRAAVNSYAWIRQVVDERTGGAEPVLSPVQWDEEDEELLADSMRDLASEAL